jgi:hypothetical protein
MTHCESVSTVPANAFPANDLKLYYIMRTDYTLIDSMSISWESDPLILMDLAAV